MADVIVDWSRRSVTSNRESDPVIGYLKCCGYLHSLSKGIRQYKTAVGAVVDAVVGASVGPSAKILKPASQPASKLYDTS
jgi:hypothetical protein